MVLSVIGINHKTAPVEVREKVSVATCQLEPALQRLRSEPGIQEAVILSTCNRTELYLCSASPALALEAAGRFFKCPEALAAREAPPLPAAPADQECDAAQVWGADGCSPFYKYQGMQVAQHLFRVAAGLDSLLVGEPQILGQVRDALQAALHARTAGPYLSRLFQHALAAGKRVRSETAIGESATSLSYVAVELARKVFGSLTGRTVLLVGAGQMSELALKTLVSHGAATVLVANRTRAHAEALAAQYGGQAVDYGQLPQWLEQADIVISSTSAPHWVIHRPQVEAAMRKRGWRRLLVVDLAVPRDVDPAVHNLEGVYLYNVDDLQSVLDANVERRRAEGIKAQAILVQEAREFSRWWTSRQAVPVIQALTRFSRQVEDQELERLFRRLPELTPRERSLIQAAARAMVNKILHKPVTRLKEAVAENNPDAVALASRLFDVDWPQASGRRGPGAEPDESRAAPQAAAGAAEEARKNGTREGGSPVVHSAAPAVQHAL